MINPLVSITTAFHNEERFLLNVIKSVFAQTFTDWEYILVDDGSTDRSLEIAQSIDDARVRVFSNGRNLGRSASLNRITSLARGKYIARMDADDMCGVQRIEKQVQLLESEPKVDAVGTGICYLNGNDSPVGDWYAPPSHNEICRNPSRLIGLCHGSILGKRAWFEKHPYDESFSISVDFNMLFRAYETSVFANIREPLYYYRLDQSFNLKKQFMARRANARFLSEHHRNAGRWGQAFLNCGIQYAKYVATVLMFVTGLRKKLMAKRFASLSEDKRQLYLKEIEAIKDIELPIRTGS